MAQSGGSNDIGSFYQQTNILGEAYEPMQAPRHTEIPTFMRAPFVTDLGQVGSLCAKRSAWYVNSAASI